MSLAAQVKLQDLEQQLTQTVAAVKGAGERALAEAKEAAMKAEAEENERQAAATALQQSMRRKSAQKLVTHKRKEKLENDKKTMATTKLQSLERRRKAKATVAKRRAVWLTQNVPRINYAIVTDDFQFEPPPAGDNPRLLLLSVKMPGRKSGKLLPRKIGKPFLNRNSSPSGLSGCH